MAIKGLSPTSVRKYVLKRDPCRGANGEPVEGSTIFVLQTLDGLAKARIKDLSVTVDLSKMDAAKNGSDVAGAMRMAVFEPAYEACRLGIQSWENFQSDAGTVIAFTAIDEVIGGRSVKVVPRDLVSRIEPDDAFELMNVIVSGASLSEVEAKK